MGLEFIYRAGAEGATPSVVAVFPGAWNPPTRAHVEVSRAAREYADELIWVMPRNFPHKGFEGASFDERRQMLETLAKAEGFSAAVSNGGLYADIAAETAECLGGGSELLLVCGRDAAERMATWDYGVPGVFDMLINRHRLLIASRNGEYEPSGEHRHRITGLVMTPDWSDISSTEVRRRIAGGEDWSGLVPPVLFDTVRRLYQQRAG